MNYFSGGSVCGSPNEASSRCPVPFYRPEEGKYYWDNNVGNCQPYFTNGCSSSGSSPQRSFDSNIYGSYEDCMSGCAFQQRPAEQGRICMKSFTQGQH